MTTAPPSTAAPAAGSAKAAPGRPRLTGPQAVAARQLVAAAAALPVSADARLFALVLAVRAARTGWANVTCQDLRRYANPHGVLDELLAGGWITADDDRDPHRVVDADPADALPLQAGGLTGLVDPPMGELMRSRVSGWITRTSAAKPLKKTDAAARLLALALVLDADPTTGRGHLPDDLPEQVLAALTPKWIVLLDGGGYQLTDAAADTLPVYQPTPQA
ncbi:hypothetical protein [Frankia sp. ACN1ag]|uniref:hypothetical protein n=1 Tax=Frankia sp. ACN1ag TaxID=102891 RepID=UPI0006DBEDE4|nr:hypothetical protein [Frankia sp. ACN1ag]